MTEKRRKKRRKKKNYFFSGHYVIASSQPLECRTFLPIYFLHRTHRSYPSRRRACFSKVVSRRRTSFIKGHIPSQVCRSGKLMTTPSHRLSVVWPNIEICAIFTSAIFFKKKNIVPRLCCALLNWRFSSILNMCLFRMIEQVKSRPTV